MLNSISASDKAKEIQASNVKTQEAVSDSGDAGSTDFDTLLKGILIPDSGNNVNEEELFSALVQEKISSLKGADALGKFQQLLSAEGAKLQAADGYIPVEQATINALKAFVGDGSLSAEEGDKIYSESFASAQLDNNKDALYDSRGGANDPTMAMAALDVALSQAKEMIEKISAGEVAVSTMSLGVASATGKAGSGNGITVTPLSSAGGYVPGNETIDPNGTFVDGEKGFLWKPITNNEQRLAVLLPATMTGHVLSVIVKDNQGNVVEEGNLQTAGIVETGQEKYTFSKKGGDYQKDLVVEVTLADGSVKSYKIADPSKRYD